MRSNGAPSGLQGRLYPLNSLTTEGLHRPDLPLRCVQYVCRFLLLITAHFILVHRWLFDHPGVLHRDLSFNNIKCRFIEETSTKWEPELNVYGVLTDYGLSSWKKDLENYLTSSL